MQDFQTTKTDDPAQWCKEDCQVFLLLFIQNWTSILPPPTRSAVTAATPTIIGHEQIPRIRVQDTQEWHEPPWVDGFRPMPANDLISKLSKPSQSDTAITPDLSSQIAKFMGPIWGPPGCCRPQMAPCWPPWTLLSGRLQFQTLKSYYKCHNLSELSTGRHNLTKHFFTFLEISGHSCGLQMKTILSLKVPLDQF